MTVGKARPQALPAGAAAIQARHLGRGAGLVDEHQPLRIKIELALEPDLSCGSDVRPILLGRVSGFF